jgi:hypothetical protein
VSEQGPKQPSLLREFVKFLADPVIEVGRYLSEPPEAPAPHTTIGAIDPEQQAAMEAEIVASRWQNLATARFNHRDTDTVVGLALRHGGIPKTVEMPFRVRAIALGTLAVLGQPMGPTGFGSSMADRRAADITGPLSVNPDGQRIWLPPTEFVTDHVWQGRDTESELITPRQLQNGLTASAIVLASNIFEHGQPSSLLRNGQAAGKRLLNIGAASVETEPVNNPQEGELLAVFNEVIIAEYGKGEERNGPGSVAPLLVGLAARLVGERQSKIDPAFAAALSRYYRKIWFANRMHITSYPQELHDLYGALMGVENQILQGGEQLARQHAELHSARQSGRTLKPRSIPSGDIVIAASLYRHKFEGPLVVMAMAEHATGLATAERQAEKKAEDRALDKIKREKREQALKEEVKNDTGLYGWAVMSDTAQVAKDGYNALNSNGRRKDPAQLLRTTMALYEQQAIGVPTAGEHYARLRDKGFTTMFDLVLARRKDITNGFVRPEEALFISTLKKERLPKSMHLKVSALQAALLEATFPEKKVRSNTLEGSEIRPETRETRHSKLYDRPVHELHAAVFTRNVANDATRSINPEQLAPPRRDRLDLLFIARVNRLTARVRELNLNDTAQRALKSELSAIGRWTREAKQKHKRLESVLRQSATR